MADWKQIEAEYITAGTSYRKLAEKYGLDLTTVARRAKKHCWQEKREQHANTVHTEILRNDIEEKVDSAARLQSTADRLLDQIDAYIAQGGVLGPVNIKTLTGALRDLKEVKMIRSPMDIDEQKARIEKLRREAQKEEDQRSRTVTVVFEAGEDSWNE